MNKRTFLGTLGSAIVGAFLSVGLKPLKKEMWVIEGKIDTHVITWVEWKTWKEDK